MERNIFSIKPPKDYREAGKKENPCKIISEELGQSRKADRTLQLMFIKVCKSPENFGYPRLRLGLGDFNIPVIDYSYFKRSVYHTYCSITTTYFEQHLDVLAVMCLSSMLYLYHFK